jgi:hypothetical protein
MWRIAMIVVARARLFAVSGYSPTSFLPLQSPQLREDASTYTLPTVGAFSTQRSVVYELPLPATPIGSGKAQGGAAATAALALGALSGIAALSLRAGSWRQHSAAPSRALLASSQRRAEAPLRMSQGPKSRHANVRMDLGFQVDPVASTTSAAILIGSVWGYMHMINLSKRRQWRDVEAQSLRTAKVMVLTGKMDPDTY